MTLKQKIHAAAALLLSCMLLTGCAASQGSLFEEEPLRVTADMDKLEVMETAPKFKIKTSFGASSEDDIVSLLMPDAMQEKKSDKTLTFCSSETTDYPRLTFVGKRTQDAAAWQPTMEEACQYFYYSRTGEEIYHHLTIRSGFQPMEGNLGRVVGEVPDGDPVAAHCQTLTEQVLQAAGHTQYRCDIAARFTPEDMEQLYQLAYGLDRDTYLTEAPIPDTDLYFYLYFLPIEGIPEGSLRASSAKYREAYFLCDKDGICYTQVPARVSLDILETYEVCTVQEAYEAAVEGLLPKYTEMYYVGYEAIPISYGVEEHELYYRFEFRCPAKLDKEYDDFIAQTGVKGRYEQLVVYVRARDCTRMKGLGWESTQSVGGHFIHQYNAPELYAQEGEE